MATLTPPRRRVQWGFSFPGHPAETGRPLVAAILCVFLATVLAAAVVRVPLGIVAAIGLGSLLALLRSPTLMVTAFGVSAFASGWFFMAGEEGIFRSPARATSVATWSALLLIALAIHRPALRARPRIALGVLLYSASVALSVPVAAMRTGDSSVLFTGAQGVLIALSPLAVMLLMTTRRGNVGMGAVVILGLLAAECVYSVVQFTHLDYLRPVTPFTVGNSISWWDWQAIFGTFSTTGKNAFGGSIALGGCVALAWTTNGTLAPHKRLLCGALFVAIALLAVLSESRSAVISLAAGTLVVILARKSAWLMLAAVTSVFLVAVLPATASSIELLQQRGVNDEDARARQNIWRAVLSDGNTSLIIGEGFGSITRVTGRLNIAGLGYSADLFEAPPPAENLYVRRLVEGGIFGFLAFTAYMSLALRETFEPSRTANGRTWRLALRATLIAFLIQSFFADTLMFQQWAAVFALILGVSGAAMVLDEESGGSDDKPADASNLPATGGA